MTGDSPRARIRDDPYAASLGIELLDLAPGYCRAALRLRPDMVNFHGSPHGGAIFSLADYAFSGACNSHGEAAVALSVTIQFLAAPEPGARLVAEAREQRQGWRAGFYAMTVTDEAGSVVATCQAVAFRRTA
jgi:acyl-CoA thioesterase